MSKLVMNDLMRALMSKGYTYSESRTIVEDMKLEVASGEDPEEVLYSEGLEPDYVFDLL